MKHTPTKPTDIDLNPTNQPMMNQPVKSTSILRVLICLSLATLALVLAGCGNRSPDPTANTVGSSEAISVQADASPAADPVATEAAAERQAQIKREAYQQLLPVIRKFERRRTAYQVSEQEYLEKLYLWSLSFAMLEMRSNPGTFAGDLPEHEIFAYQQYVEAAEDVHLEVGVYLDRRATESDPEVGELRRWRSAASDALALPLPSSGSRLADAIATMSDPKFKAVVNTSNTRLTQLAVVSGGHVAHTVTDGSSKALQYLNSLLSH